MIARWDAGGDVRAHAWPDDATLPRAGETVRVWFSPSTWRVSRLEWDILDPDDPMYGEPGHDDAVTVVLEHAWTVKAMKRKKQPPRGARATTKPAESRHEP